MSNNSVVTTLVGVPIDCTGRDIGVERMPAALRAAGLVTSLNIRDNGDLATRINDSRRDPVTGMIGFQQVCVASSIIREEIGAILARQERPLVIGGCCTLLVGVSAALQDQFGRVSLAFVDGHQDFYNGKSSSTGEAADMDLAILTGNGPSGLVDIARVVPLVQPEDVFVLGYRDADEASREHALEPTVVAPGIHLFDAQMVRKEGPAVLGTNTANALSTNPGRFWLHLDLDVLDQDILPAVDYLMPNGLNWDEVTALVRPLATSPALIGADVTIYNPTLDPDGRYAKRIVQLLSDIFMV